MKTKTFDRHIHDLLTIAPTDAPFVSCYLDMLGRDRSEVLADFDQQAHLAVEGYVGGRLDSLHAALRNIREYLVENFDLGTASIACFARCSSSAYFLAMPFKVALPSEFHVSRRPRIYPLMEARDLYDRFLLVVTTDFEASIFEMSLGSTTGEYSPEDLLSIKKSIPCITKERYHHDRLPSERDLVSEKVRILGELVDEKDYKSILLAGDDARVASLYEALPPILKTKAIPVGADASVACVEEVYEEAIDTFREHEKTQSFDRVLTLSERVLAGGLAVTGVDACVSALEDGFAEVLILNRALEATEDRERLVRAAALAGVEVETVADSRLLNTLGGAGCLLRYHSSHQPDALLFEDELLMLSPVLAS